MIIIFDELQNNYLVQVLPLVHHVTSYNEGGGEGNTC